MAKGVFMTKVEPAYDDLPEVRYHFQDTYLNQVKATVGDWIVYYEPRRSTGEESSRGGRLCYFATARVMRIAPDESREKHFYALMEGYLEFTTPVPFRAGAHYYESALRRADGRTNKGAFGRAVRTMPELEYEQIVRAGFQDALTAPPSAEERWLGEPVVMEGVERSLVASLVTRPVRERCFSRAVREAYHDSCALTGLRIINGGGRAEIEAAHVRSVEDDGPDSPRNGIALSRTVHWMFDRGLLALQDDGLILISSKGLPEQAVRLLHPDRRARFPSDLRRRPHPQFLAYHRRKHGYAI